MTTNSYRLSLKVIFMSSLMLGSTLAIGQQTTERYIPIGSSPGISSKYSYIGRIVSVDEQTRTIVVDSDRGSKTIRIAPVTRLWLDRSKNKRTNMDASYSDCKVGRNVEVMYDHTDSSVAIWIKIESS